MRNIEMVDLKAQYDNLSAEIDEAIKSVLNAAIFIKGPDIKEFESELQAYLKVRHVITCANGTDALQIAMMALGLQPGDEIITTNFTFIATVEVVALLGLKLVLVDPEDGTFNISPAAIRKAITPRTKAIVPVHLFGQCANMEEIIGIAAENNLYVIEDAAQATGADYFFSNGKSVKAGTIGHIGTTSFFPSKSLACYGDGGALYTNDDDLALRLRSIANHGMKERYYYDEIGINSRLDTLQAAILKVKLKYLDSFNARRKEVADFYDEAFLGCHAIRTPERSGFSTHIFHQYTIKVPARYRKELKDFLQEKKIPSMIYYPLPLHLQNAYKYLGHRKGDFPVTENLCETVLSLPMYPELEQDQLDYITSNILKFFESKDNGKGLFCSRNGCN